MKKDFANEDFEEFLKQSADSLRMKAPEKVWETLSKELNKRRRRFIIGLSTFLLITSAIGYYTITQVTEPTGVSSKQINQQQNTGEKIIGESTSLSPIQGAQEKISLTAEPFPALLFYSLTYRS
jgi:hypothetical protein